MDNGNDMNVKQIKADIRRYIEFSCDSEIPALERDLLANGCSESQLEVIRKAKKAFDEWCNSRTEYEFGAINSKVNSMIEKTNEKVIGRMLIIPPRSTKAYTVSPFPKTVIASPARKANADDKPSKANYDGNTKVKLLAGSSGSSIGKFIVNKLNGSPEITCDQLADAIVNEFRTKTGIQPDLKWAVRNIKLFIEKGLIKAE